MYCNNCGHRDHTYNRCKYPILSYGLLLIHKFDDTYKLLMIQRKDSIHYIEFLRGKYNICNIEYIKLLLNKCSVYERYKLLTKSFDRLWNDLWFSIKKYEPSQRMIKEYTKGQNQFNQLNDGILINGKIITLNDIINMCYNNYKTPEWEFPKGRRSNRESNIQCAIREFEEETNIPSVKYSIISNIRPFIEDYCSDNNVKYRHVYYISLHTSNESELSIDKEKFEQASEISDIQWLTLDECKSKIRTYNKSKYTIIEKVKTFLDKYNEDLFIK